MWAKRSATFRYAVYGALFGLFFPIFSTVWELLARQLPLTLESFFEVQISTPLLWVINTAPLFLGLFAGLAGTRQDRLIRLNAELGQGIQERDQALHRLEPLQINLEQRTADLEQQATQIAIAADVGRIVVSILELEILTRKVVELVRERFGFYYVGLFLLDEADASAGGQYAVLEAGSGEAGQIMKEQGHKLEVGGISMVGSVCAQRQPRIALDVGLERVRFENPLLPETRSELALPLVIGERVLGALDVQSTQAKAFSNQDIAILQLVADQVAVAVDNARTFSKESELLEASNPILRVSRRLGEATRTGEVVQVILDSVAETEADGCGVATFDAAPDGQVESLTFLGSWDRMGQTRPPAGVPIRPETQFSAETVMEFFVVEDVEQDTQLPEEFRIYISRGGRAAAVNIPLQVGTRDIGFVTIDRIQAGPFSPESMQFYESLADQAAAALERVRLLEEMQQRATHERVVSEISAQVRASLDPDVILKTGVREVARLLGAERVSIEITGPGNGNGNSDET